MVIHSGASKGQARPAGVGSGVDLYVARNARSLNLRFRCVEELAVGVRGLPDCFPAEKILGPIGGATTTPPMEINDQ